MTKGGATLVPTISVLPAIFDGSALIALLALASPREPAWACTCACAATAPKPNNRRHSNPKALIPVLHNMLLFPIKFTKNGRTARRIPVSNRFQTRVARNQPFAAHIVEIDLNAGTRAFAFECQHDALTEFPV